eukprot:193588-Rhodomonas_salina.5
MKVETTEQADVTSEGQSIRPGWRGCKESRLPTPSHRILDCLLARVSLRFLQRMSESVSNRGCNPSMTEPDWPIPEPRIGRHTANARDKENLRNGVGVHGV